MSRRLALALALMAATALAAALVVPGAGAATKVRSKITIGVSGSTLKGKVKSRKRSCIKGRRVVVYRGHRAIGRTKTNKRGKWHKSVGRAGSYHAVAKKKKHHSTVCKRARSRTVTIGGGGGGGGGAASTTLTIRFTSGPYTGTFAGTVRSPDSACISGRTVSVYMQGSTTPIGSDTSNSSGSWQVSKPSVPSGMYFAATPAKSSGSANCAAGQSSAISAP
jgi:hypothetical protein